MRHLIGLPFFAFGAWLLWSAWQRRRQVQAAVLEAPSPAVGAATRNNSLAIMGEVMPPLMVGFLALCGLKLTLAYFAIGASRWLSLFDLGGFLFLLASYSAWLLTMTKYRLTPALAVADAATAAGTEHELSKRRADADGRGPADRGGDPDHAGRGVRDRDLAAEVAPAAEGGTGGRRAA